MALATDPDDQRIDLDGIDMLGAMTQCRSDVGAGAGAEDQHVVERVAEDRIRPLIEVSLWSTGAID